MRQGAQREPLAGVDQLAVLGVELRLRAVVHEVVDDRSLEKRVAGLVDLDDLVHEPAGFDELTAGDGHVGDARQRDLEAVQRAEPPISLSEVLERRPRQTEIEDLEAGYPADDGLRP